MADEYFPIRYQTGYWADLYWPTLSTVNVAVASTSLLILTEDEFTLIMESEDRLVQETSSSTSVTGGTDGKATRKGGLKISVARSMTSAPRNRWRY